MDSERQQAEDQIKSVANLVRPIRHMYTCEVCQKRWMKWFFVTKLFKRFPRVRFCGKVCRSARSKGGA